MTIIVLDHCYLVHAHPTIFLVFGCCYVATASTVDCGCDAIVGRKTLQGSRHPPIDPRARRVSACSSSMRLVALLLAGATLSMFSVAAYHSSRPFRLSPLALRSASSCEAPPSGTYPPSLSEVGDLASQPRRCGPKSHLYYSLFAQPFAEDLRQVDSITNGTLAAGTRGGSGGGAPRTLIDRLARNIEEAGRSPVGSTATIRSYLGNFARSSPEETRVAANKGATRIISRLGRAGYVALAAEVFERLCADVPGGADERSYSAMMSVFNKHEKYSDTLRLLHRMLESPRGVRAPVRPDLVVLKCAARAAYFALPWDHLPAILDFAAQALQEENHKGGTDEVSLASVVETVFTDILHSTENASTCAAQAAELWSWVGQRHPRLLRHQRLADTRFAAACRFGTDADIRAVCYERDSIGVRPSTFFLNAVLNRCADKNGTYAAAKRVIDRLCNSVQGGSRLEPDAVSFDLLLRICAHHGDASGAREALGEMEGRGVAPTAHTKFLQFKLFGEVLYSEYPRAPSLGNCTDISCLPRRWGAPPGLLPINASSSSSSSSSMEQLLMKQAMLPREVSPHMFCLAIENATARSEVISLLLRARSLFKLDCAVYLAGIRFALKHGNVTFAVEIANSLLDSGMSISKYGLSSLISLGIQIRCEDGLALMYRTLHACRSRSPELLTDAVCDRVIAALVTKNETGDVLLNSDYISLLVALQLHAGPLLGLRCKPKTLSKLLQRAFLVLKAESDRLEDQPSTSNIKLYEPRGISTILFSELANVGIDEIRGMLVKVLGWYCGSDGSFLPAHSDVAAEVEKLLSIKLEWSELRSVVVTR